MPLVRIAIMLVILLCTGTALAADTPVSKQWRIPCLGTLLVPEKLEIIDAKDVLLEIARLESSIRTSRPGRSPMPSPEKLLEEMDNVFDSEQLGLYQLAFKNDNTYNTAFVLAAKIPEQYYPQGLGYFTVLQKTTVKEQEAGLATVLAQLDILYLQHPELRRIAELEILEAAPLRTIHSAGSPNAQIIGTDISLTLRLLRLVYPLSASTYLIQNSDSLYLFAVITPGPERRFWNSLIETMLGNMYVKRT